MAIKSYNITVQEQVKQVLRYRRPIITGADDYVETGESLEQAWTGPWAELEARMRAMRYSNTQRIDCTLTRIADGDMAELTVTTTYYTASPGGGGGSGEGGEEASKPGESKEHPAYEVQVQMVQEPILTHPKFQSLNADVLNALKMVMDGYKLSEKILCADGERRAIDEVLKSTPSPLTELVKHGLTHYLSPSITLTARYKAQSVPQLATAGQIVSSVPGGFGTPQGRNWFYGGPSVSMEGEQIIVSEVYQLSGVGGWDTNIYSSS